MSKRVAAEAQKEVKADDGSNDDSDYDSEEDDDGEEGTARKLENVGRKQKWKLKRVNKRGWNPLGVNGISLNSDWEEGKVTADWGAVI